MFEAKNQAIATTKVFIIRQCSAILLGISLIVLVLFIGTLGYHNYANLNWINAFLNASMILSGMGPVNTMPNNAAKLFASFYALFCGIGFFSILGIIFAPVVHRLYHKFSQDQQ